MENKKCKQCGQEFTVENADLEFYKKVSPEIDGEVLEIPAPTLCPDCRIQRRFAFRNERKLYSNECQSCQKSIVTIYAPNSPYKPYCMDCWYSDKWDGSTFAMDYDPSRSFLKQFKELMLKVPRLAVMSPNNENSEYINGATGNKDCYLIFVSDHNENSAYSEKILNCMDVLDSTDCERCEYCYSLNGCTGCSRSQFLIDCHDTNDSRFCFDCRGCNDCFLCAGLRQKQFCIENQQYSKEEYEKKVTELFDHSQKSVDANWEKLLKLKAQHPHLFMHGNKNENSSGDYIYNCKDSHDCFESHYLENSKFSIAGNHAKDIYDCYVPVDETELVLESVSMSNLVSSAFTFACYNGCHNIYYSEYMNGCRNCFGCSGLSKKEFCILNKQYTEEEYNKLVPEIVASMRKNGEWGEYFPISLSPYGYNETAAHEYYPLTEKEAAALGASWQDEDFAPNYSGEFYEPKEDIREYIGSEGEVTKLLNSAIKCKISGRPFKVTKQEVAFYLKNLVPIPTKHYDVRYAERLALRNPRKTYHRKCMNDGCVNGFDTTYAPDCPAKVFCRSCYEKTVS